ncbi:MAG TPA: hypothetical protein VNZ55_12455 [Thermomicrobiales bacterium]|nr:hypothetical protein [Thermomicrobiales bacterium]
MTMRMSIPIEDRQLSRTARQTMQGWFRVFLIEFRRSPAIIGATVIGIITAVAMKFWLADGVVRWRELNESVSALLVPLSAVAAGIAAFTAQRDLTRGIVDQIASTTHGIGPRHLASFLPVPLWAIVGNLIVVSSYFSYATWRATWAGPEWGTVVITQGAILVGSGLGWFLGTIVPHRLAPITAMMLVLVAHAGYLLAMMAGGNLKRDAWGAWIVESSDVGWQPLFPAATGKYLRDAGFVTAQTTWLVAVTALLCAFSVAWKSRSAWSLVAMIVALATCLFAATHVIGGASVKPAVTDAPPMPLVCEDGFAGEMMVCMRQEDAALLQDSGNAIVDLLRPVADIPGVPKRFEQRGMMSLPQGAGDNSSKVSFQIWDRGDIRDYSFQWSLLYAMLPVPDGMQLGAGVPEYVVTWWLLEEAGAIDDELPYHRPISLLEIPERMRTLGITNVNDPRLREESVDPIEFEADVIAARDRFLAMPDAERHVWLEANWDDLMHGRLTLEDLP